MKITQIKCINRLTLDLLSQDLFSYVSENKKIHNPSNALKPEDDTIKFMILFLYRYILPIVLRIF
jgi:hypothetical protein